MPQPKHARRLEPNHSSSKKTRHTFSTIAPTGHGCRDRELKHLREMLRQRSRQPVPRSKPLKKAAAQTPEAGNQRNTANTMPFISSTP